MYQSQRAAMGGAEAFLEYLRFSKQDSDKFWEQIASEFDWIRRSDTVQKGMAIAECKPRPSLLEDEVVEVARRIRD
jgi:hypothetical protein